MCRAADGSILYQFSKEEMDEKIASLRKSTDPADITPTWTWEYYYSQGIRADNTPEFARYLGYLDGKKLYPDLELTTLESFFQDVVDGRVPPIYQEKFGTPTAQ